jgi:chemotaxis protein CheY-P-specific phosphatase CheC
MANLIKENTKIEFYNFEEIKKELKENKTFKNETIEIRKCLGGFNLYRDNIKLRNLLEEKIKIKKPDLSDYDLFILSNKEMKKYNRVYFSGSLDDDKKLKDFLDVCFLEAKISFEISKLKTETEKKGKGKDMFTHLFSTNETAHFFLTKENEKDFLKGSDLELKKEILKDFNEIGFIALEMPLNFDIAELSTFLKDIKKIKEFLKLENISITLRIKKFNKKYNFTGLYNPDLKTIVLDGRDKNAFIHELGHYIFENKIEIENFQPTETERLKQYKEGTHASYNLESEKFALSFEDKFIDLFF